MKKGSQVLMYDGSVKNCEDVVINDIMMGDDSTPRIVNNTLIGNGQLYTIIPNDSTDSYTVSEDTIMCMKYNTQPRITNPSKKEIEAKKARYRLNYNIIEYHYDPISSSTLSIVVKKIKNFSVNVHGKKSAIKQANNMLLKEMEIYISCN